MTRDRSLDEFFGGGESADDADTESDADENADAGGRATDADEGGNESVESAEGGMNRENDADDPVTLPDTSDADPATPTYRWTPDGAACKSCGSVVNRRWEDDGAFVCDDCKEW